LQELGAERPILVGHSWGTLPAIAMALNGDVDATGLVLVSGFYYPETRGDVPIAASAAIPVIGDVMRFTVSPVLGRLTAGSVFRKLFAPAPVTPEFAARFPTGLALRPWQIRAVAADTGLMIPGAAALSPRYRELDLPVAILSGDGDRIVDVGKHAERLHKALPASELKVLPGVGHMLHHTNPAAVTTAIRNIAPK
jgi:pimeloyl-ACP methyl ester carboxylesterase